MAKIKHTKTELKAQNEALSRFKRFLPMLVLKKQQLQAEIQRILSEIEAKRQEELEIQSNLKTWVCLFSEDIDINEYITLEEVNTHEGNIAGVRIPLFQSLSLKKNEPDLFLTPPWVDDGIEVVEKLMEAKIHREILEQQLQLISEELRTTSQRVNLFEKVKIPECNENIRTIKIFLGDEQTASVVRGKIAKKRT